MNRSSRSAAIPLLGCTLTVGMLLATSATRADSGSPPAVVEPTPAGGPIDAAGLAATVRFLSSDALEGRGPGSRGDQVARLYLSSELEALGLVPGVGTGAGAGSPSPTWEQSFPMVGIDSQAPATWEFQAPGGRVALARREEFIAASGVQAATATIQDSEVVFVGYGIQAPEYG